jgi:hypothetical protein
MEIIQFPTPPARPVDSSRGPAVVHAFDPRGTSESAPLEEQTSPRPPRRSGSSPGILVWAVVMLVILAVGMLLMRFLV